MDVRSSDQSFANLIRELRDEATLLVRQEVALAKTEVTEKAKRMTRNVIFVAAGAAVAFAAGLVLLLALSELLFVGLVRAGLGTEIAAWLGPLLVGIATGIVGWVLVNKGKRGLAEQGFLKSKTKAAEKDSYWLKQKSVGT